MSGQMEPKVDAELKQALEGMEAMQTRILERLKQMETKLLSAFGINEHTDGGPIPPELAEWERKYADAKKKAGTAEKALSEILHVLIETFHSLFVVRVQRKPEVPRCV